MLGLSQTEVGKRYGATQATVSRWHKDKKLPEPDVKAGYGMRWSEAAIRTHEDTLAGRKLLLRDRRESLDWTVVLNHIQGQAATLGTMPAVKPDSPRGAVRLTREIRRNRSVPAGTLFLDKPQPLIEFLCRHGFAERANQNVNVLTDTTVFG